MDFALEPVGLDQKPVLRHLLELYQYDFSEFCGEDVSEQGLFGYRYLDHYWTEAGRHPFFVRVSGKLAGFALVRTLGTGADTASELAEFFILRKYRRRGIGQAAAHRLFDRFPGPWRVHQEAQNRPAQAFWRKTIAHYTAGQFTDRSRRGRKVRPRPFIPVNQGSIVQRQSTEQARNRSSGR